MSERLCFPGGQKSEAEILNRAGIAMESVK
jgi:hypothetical protein